MDEIIVNRGDQSFGDSQPRTYKMIALRGMVAFPYHTFHFDISRDKSLLALNKATELEQDVVLVAQKHAQMLNPAPKDIFRIGTLCRIKQVMRLSNDNVRVFMQGLERVSIESYVSVSPYFEVSVKEVEPVISDPIHLEALKRQSRDYYDEFIKLDTRNSQEGVTGLNPSDSDRFVNTIVYNLFKSDAEKQKILEETVMEKRLETVCIFLASETEIIKVEKRISAKVRRQMDKNQREYYLREQVKAIHEELGDGEEEIEELRKKAESLKLPQEVFDKVDKELKRLSKMSGTSPEAAVIRTYVEWLLEVPWSERTKDNHDLKRAQEILDADHFGLEKVKERIIEYLAVNQLTKTLKGPILCFVGPPGVGKTSIVKSIARTLDRKFVTMSLGGVRDEAEIRGHRRTYIGAIPGRVISQMKLAGTVNPVFLFDEIDKMSSDYKGDPASAMLEVLDPEQNFQFRDHYMEVPYNLSQVMFVTTANSMESIPAPLLDRMEVIELSGYTEEEKVQIAKKYLIPKQLKANGMEKVSVKIDDDTVKTIIYGYTKESGVRNLEREIASLCRKIAKTIVVDKPGEAVFEINNDNIEKYLGVIKFPREELSKKDLEGAATGLAWTSVGGTTLTIEVGVFNGKGDIQLTGNLGDVMKESARAALTLIRQRADKYGIPEDMFIKKDIHIHVPEGATPKDGPSAGITMATALMSALSGKPVKREVAMTGEITLRGNVLAIGGLKEKCLAAYRAGITELVLPLENRKDWAEIPENIRNIFKVTFADTVDEVFAAALRGENASIQG